jgi:hypothetical protein
MLVAGNIDAIELRNQQSFPTVAVVRSSAETLTFNVHLLNKKGLITPHALLQRWPKTCL